MLAAGTLALGGCADDEPEAEPGSGASTDGDGTSTDAPPVQDDGGTTGGPDSGIDDDSGRDDSGSDDGDTDDTTGGEPSHAAVGHWTSPGCEWRPDGQGSFMFVQRDFEIGEDDWSGTIDFFMDQECSLPMSSVYLAGAWSVGADSVAVYGAQQADFALDEFRITPLDEGFAGYLDSARPGTCGTEPWQVGQEQDVTDTGCSVIGVDLDACGTEHELLYVDGGQLFFGSRHDDGSNLCTPEDRPIRLQTPLVADEGVVPSDDPQDGLPGEWASPICERRPDGQGGLLFIQRQITVGDDGTWEGTFAFFGDEDCTFALSEAEITGPYQLGASSIPVHGATEADFEMADVRLTARAQGFVDFLNSAQPGTCGAEAWQVDVTQDISETGCSLLGIDLDSCGTEHELVMVRGDRLHFGGRPDDGSNLCTAQARPISLQTPMLRQ